MALRIPIDHTKLTDSPYGDSNKSFFTFSSAENADLVYDIVKGHPTCYLVSGYRGAGKSSFIKKLESDVLAKSTNTVFVHLNFAKPEGHSIVLRKLVRSFYLHIDANIENKRLKLTEELKPTVEKLHDLYERTFFEVAKNSNVRKGNKTVSVSKFEGNLAEIILSICSIIAFVILSLNLDLTKTSSFPPIILSLFAALVLPLTTFFSFSESNEQADESINEHSKTSFYDDEIAEYYLLNILTSFKTSIKTVFILDELDKINDNTVIENVINELKPVMLSGLASFIVVAGQNLYYSYYFARAKDDNPLSTLFSKVHHVSLMSTGELKTLFDKLVRSDRITLNPSDQQLLDAFKDFVVLCSWRIPRRFVTLIRQKLIWENEEAFIDITMPFKELQIYSHLLQKTETIQNQMISAEGYPSAISDYLIMQLFLKVDSIIHR